MASKCSCRSPVGPGATHGRQFDVRERSDTCCGSALLPHRAPSHFVPSTAPGNSRRLGALRTGGMSSNARTPRNQGCSPVFAAVCRALHGAAHQSLHGFADGSSGCQGTRSFPSLLVCLWLYPSCCSAQRSSVLLTQGQWRSDHFIGLFPTSEVAVSIPSFCRRLQETNQIKRQR